MEGDDDWVHHTFPPVDCFYNAQNGDGYLLDGTSISVRYENPHVSRNKLISLRHKNLWLGDIEDRNTGCVLYSRGGETFTEYLSENPFVFEFFLSVSPDEVVDQVSITYLSDEFRGFCRGVVKLFIHMHSFNMSLVDLDISQFVVLNGKLILTNPDLFEVNEDDWKNNDFRMLADVFQIAFDNYGGGQAMPPDFSALLNFMRNYNHRDVDFMILKDHLALLKTPKRLAMIRAFREKRKKISREDYEFILESMDGCDQDWTTDFCDDFRPEFGVANNCYNHTLEGELISVYYLTEIERQDPKELRFMAIKFARDMIVHIPDHIRQYHALPYVDMELEMTVMYFFSEHLLSFHRAARDTGMLNIFMGD